MRKLTLILAALIFGSWSPVAQSTIQTRYFLVGFWHPDYYHVGSYILGLDDPSSISDIQDQLKLPVEDRDWVTSVIHQNPNWINRDYLNGGRLWHWHAHGLIGIGGAGPADWGWTPPFVESFGNDWIGEDGRPLTYGVVHRELTMEELFFVTPTLGESGAILEWLNLGPGYVYTVEAASLDAPGSWTEVEGTGWPITATTWTDASSLNEGSRFYRVRAEKTE